MGMLKLKPTAIDVRSELGSVLPSGWTLQHRNGRIVVLANRVDGSELQMWNVVRSLVFDNDMTLRLTRDRPRVQEYLLQTQRPDGHAFEVLFRFTA